MSGCYSFQTSVLSFSAECVVSFLLNMAMSSKPQLLIHDGELNQIVGMIKASKNPEVKLGGSLFGL